MKLALHRLRKQHGVSNDVCMLPLVPPTPGSMILEGYASTPDRDLDRVSFRQHAFCWPPLHRASEVPLLYKHDPQQVAGTIVSLVQDRQGLRIRCTVTHELARRCTGFSVQARVLAYELREPDSPSFHAVVTQAELISVTPEPANPKALVTSRHAVPASNTFFDLMHRRVAGAQQLVTLLKGQLHARHP